MRPHGLSNDVVLVDDWDNAKGESHVCVVKETGNISLMTDINLTTGTVRQIDIGQAIPLAASAMLKTNDFEELAGRVGEDTAHMVLSCIMFIYATKIPGEPFLRYKNEILTMHDTRANGLIIYIGPATIIGIPEAYEGKEMFEPAFEFTSMCPKKEREENDEKLRNLFSAYPEIENVLGKLDKVKTSIVSVIPSTKEN